MRHARPVFLSLSAQVWRTAAFAFLFTLAAGVLALALPFVVMHAIEAAERRESLDGLLFVAGLGLTAAILRAALLAARDRLMLQAALWLDHTAGSAILTDRLDRGVMPGTLDADRIALDQCVRAIAGPATTTLLDAIAALVPLTLLFLIHPALGAVSLVFIAGIMASGLARARAAALAQDTATLSRAAADKAWRTAAANGPMIAARRMSAGIVADWETLSRAAIVSDYTQARPAQHMTAVLRALDLVSCVVVAIFGVWLVQSDSLTLAGLAAAVVLHVMLARAAITAHEHVPELAGLEAALSHLATSPVAMAGITARQPTQHPVAQPQVAAPGPAAVISSPAPDMQAPLAPVAALPPRQPAANRPAAPPRHPARPTFEPAAPLPAARPPAAYGSGSASRGGP